MPSPYRRRRTGSQTRRVALHTWFMGGDLYPCSVPRLAIGPNARTPQAMSTYWVKHDSDGFEQAVLSLDLGSDTLKNCFAVVQRIYKEQPAPKPKPKPPASGTGKGKGPNKQKPTFVRLVLVSSWYDFIVNSLLSKSIMTKMVSANVEGASASLMAKTLIPYLTEVIDVVANGKCGEQLTSFFAENFKHRVQALHLVLAVASLDDGVAPRLFMGPFAWIPGSTWAPSVCTLASAPRRFWGWVQSGRLHESPSCFVFVSLSFSLSLPLSYLHLSMLSLQPSLLYDDCASPSREADAEGIGPPTNR